MAISAWAAYIYPFNGSFYRLLTPRNIHTHILLLRDTLSLTFHTNWSFNHPRSKAKDLSREKLVCIHSWWLVFAQVKTLACYSWWLGSPRWSWWSGCFFRSLPNWLWEPEEEVCTWLKLHHAGDGERRLLVSTLVSVTWEVTRLLVTVTTWIKGVCQHIDTTGKNPIVSCPLFTFKHLFSCNLFMCLTLEIIT